MIDHENAAVFPNNVVSCLQIVFPGIDEDVQVLGRPLRPTDGALSIGVYGTTWNPEEDSYEMGHTVMGGGPGPQEPTLSRYQIGIQTMVKDGDSERGLSVSSILAKRVRSVLYRNEPLHIALASLYTQDPGGPKESMRRWGIRGARYMSNELDGAFVFISVLDMWIETELN